MYGEIWLEKHRFKFYFRTQSGNECIPHSRISQPTTTWLYSPYLPFSQSMTQLRTIIYFLPMFWDSFCFAWSNTVYIHFNAVSTHIQMHEISKLVWWVFKLAFHAFNHVTIDTFCLVYYISFPLKVSWFCSYLSWLCSIQRWGDLQTSILQVL